MWNNYPYINENDLNLDYILKTVKQLKETVETFISTETVTFADPILWNIATQYAKNTIVLSNSGDAYLSKQTVPSNIQLNNTDYWQEIFNFADYVRTANSNLTFNIEQGTTRATQAYIVGDWLLWDDVLYKVLTAIAIDDLFVVDTNIEHFTVEDFIKAFMTWCTSTINQYKDDIDASELAYRNQLALDIANTTASLQTQLNAVISGATVNSEVILARVGFDLTTYTTLKDRLDVEMDIVSGNILEDRNAFKAIGAIEGTSLTSGFGIRKLATGGASLSGDTVVIASGSIGNDSYCGYGFAGSSVITGLRGKKIEVTFDVNPSTGLSDILIPSIETDVNVADYTVYVKELMFNKARFIFKIGDSASGLNFRCVVKVQNATALTTNKSFVVENGNAIDFTANSISALQTEITANAGAIETTNENFSAYSFDSDAPVLTNYALRNYTTNGSTFSVDTLTLTSGTNGNGSFIGYGFAGSSNVQSLRGKYLECTFDYLASDDISAITIPTISTDANASDYDVIEATLDNGIAHFKVNCKETLSGSNFRFVILVQNINSLATNITITVSNPLIIDLKYSKFLTYYRNKKIGMFGDSITWGSIGGGVQTTYGLPYWVGKLLGLEVVNYGVGSQGWLAQVGGANGLDKIKAMASDIPNLDVITMQYGSNDGSQTLGTYTDTAENTTIMGQIYNAYTYIKSLNPKCQVILVTPPNSTVGTGSTFPRYWYGRTLPAGHTGADMIEEYHKFAEYYGTPIIDYYECPMTSFNINDLLADGVHPNVDGYEVLGGYLASQIAKYI